MTETVLVWSKKSNTTCYNHLLLLIFNLRAISLLSVQANLNNSAQEIELFAHIVGCWESLEKMVLLY